MTSQIPFIPMTPEAMARLTLDEQMAFEAATMTVAQDQKPSLEVIATLVLAVQRLIAEPGDRPAGSSRWQHRRSGTEVDAIQWTGLNFDAVKAFASGALGLWNTASGVLPLFEATTGAVRRLEPGHWVVHEPEGGCGRYTGPRFARIFKRTDPVTELRQRPGDQQLPVPNDGPSMHDLVIADLEIWTGPEADAVRALLAERKRIGLERYGSLLQSGNGRDWLRDLREELADAAVYARQGLEEAKGGPPDLKAAEAYEAVLIALETAHEISGGESGHG